MSYIRRVERSKQNYDDHTTSSSVYHSVITGINNRIFHFNYPHMHEHKLSLQEVKEMDMVDYLKSVGLAPQRIRGNDYWYLSPLHEEHMPSFKVNRQLNCWFDHSSGTGGNLVDFCLLYHKCTVKELLQKMDSSLSFPQQKSSVLSLDDFATLDHRFRKVLININVDNQLLYWLLLHEISGFIKRNLQPNKRTSINF